MLSLKTRDNDQSRPSSGLRSRSQACFGNVHIAIRLPVVLICSLAAILASGCGSDGGSAPDSAPQAQTKNNPSNSLESAASTVRHLPALSDPIDRTAFALTDTDAGHAMLDRKVLALHLVSGSDFRTTAFDTLTELFNKVSQENAAAGLRILSLTEEGAPPIPTTVLPQSHDGSGTVWLAGNAPRALLAALFESSRGTSDATPADTLMNNDQIIVLLDRTGRVRGRYSSNEDGIAEQLLLDVGHVLPEFSPAQFGYPSSSDTNVTHIAQPPEILDLEWLQIAAQQQAAKLDQATLEFDFRFTDQTPASGITFDPQIVDDQRWRLLVNHYDHGNGICVADVNADGHLDLFFVAQTGHNELYVGVGNGTFRNETAGSGLSFPGRICVTATFADIDNDGDPDLYLTCVRSGNLLLENDGSGNFADVTEASGTAYSGHSSAPVFFDYDRDGLLDLFLCNVGKYTTEDFAELRVETTSSLPEGEVPSYYVGRKDAFAGHLRADDTEHSLLFRNAGQFQFDDVTKQTGLQSDSWSGDATPIDANNDGWPDLFVLNMQGHDEYFENQEGKRFVRKTNEVFPATSWGAMGVKSFDFDGNGLLDLFVTDMHSDMSKDISYSRERDKSNMQWPASFLGTTDRNIFGNSFFLQRVPGQFEEVSDAINAENYWPWGLSTGDLNADGFIDAFLSSSMCFPYRYGINTVLLNDHGKTFRHCEFALGVEPRPTAARMKPWFEVSSTGDESEHPMCIGREGVVRVWSCLGTRSSAMIDVDEDGDLDIVTSEFNSRPQVLVSDLAQRRPDISYLKVVLQGTKSNRDGLGARVTVVTGDRRLVQIHDGKTGYLSQGTAPLYFGLGATDSVDSIEIDWPSGGRQVLDGPIETQTLLKIVEPQ